MPAQVLSCKGFLGTFFCERAQMFQLLAFPNPVLLYLTSRESQTTSLGPSTKMGGLT